VAAASSIPAAVVVVTARVLEVAVTQMATALAAVAEALTEQSSPVAAAIFRETRPMGTTPAAPDKAAALILRDRMVSQS